MSRESAPSQASKRLFFAGVLLLAASTLLPWYNVTSLAYEPEHGPPPPEIIPNGSYNLWQGLALASKEQLLGNYSVVFLVAVATVLAIGIAAVREARRGKRIAGLAIMLVVCGLAGLGIAGSFAAVSPSNWLSWSFYKIRPNVGPLVAAAGALAHLAALALRH